MIVISDEAINFNTYLNGKIEYKENECIFFLCQAVDFRPFAFEPFLTFLRILVIGNETCLLVREPHTLQELANVVHRIENPKPLMDQVLDHWRAPAGSWITSLSRSVRNDLIELLFLRFGQFLLPSWRFLGSKPLDTVKEESTVPEADRFLTCLEDIGDHSVEWVRKYRKGIYDQPEMNSFLF